MVGHAGSQPPSYDANQPGRSARDLTFGGGRDTVTGRIDLRMPILIRLFIAAVVIGLMVYFLPSVVRIALIFLAACAVASALNPLVHKLPWRRGISGSVVAFGTAGLIIGGFVLAGYLAAGPLQENIQPWSEFRSDLNSRLTDVSGRIGLESPITVGVITQQAAGWMTGDSGTPVVAQLASKLVDIIVAVVLIAFGVIFLLAGDPYVMLRGVQKLLSPTHARQLEAAAVELSASLRWWLIGHLISATVIATLASLGFWLIDLPFAIPLGIAAGVASFIPVLGPTLVGLVAIVVGASESTQTGIWAAVVFAVVETVESYVLIPVVMKQAISLPPIVSLFTVVFWARVFGVLGLLLALPIDLVIWTALKHFVIEAPHDPHEDHATARIAAPPAEASTPQRAAAER